MHLQQANFLQKKLKSIQEDRTIQQMMLEKLDLCMQKLKKKDTILHLIQKIKSTHNV